VLVVKPYSASSQWSLGSLFLLPLALGACAPSLATMQGAHVAQKGHFAGTAALEVGVPTDTLTRVVDAGTTLAEAAESRMLTAEERRQVFEAGVTLAASPPALGQHLMLAYVPIRNLEANLRNAGGGWRLGARYQLLNHEDGPFDLSVGFGAARSTYKLPIPDIIPFLEIKDFTRYSFDVPVLIGTSRSWFRAWVGPRFLYSRFSTQMQFAPPTTTIELASFRGSSVYFGGQAGFAVGYKHVFFGVELTVTKMSGSAEVAVPSAMTAIDPFNFSGWVVYPTFGLMAEI
jgi:hypothetical protein